MDNERSAPAIPANWEIGVIDLDEGDDDTGRRYYVHVRHMPTQKLLDGAVFWHDEHFFMEEIKHDDFLLLKPVAMRLLVQLARDMVPQLVENGEYIRNELVALESWLEVRCENDDGKWLFRIIDRSRRCL